ncbi:MAG: energy transducer TonB [Desulfobacterales bacterium]|uniref:Energy transducer TonB n=1 Tax=Candidatus Desulfaltia bathyphila TaxID=2841697 RepID=A0A8J6TC87_9BACT|nr:energy transducer TonB [Candidatus Desulfaltia bathyphila]MBL7195254.1 energy transducer TonB [Desulfobacterales bacterium]MBL7207310.1 energy transducer TonB [Desulfobacterales bacterium]
MRPIIFAAVLAIGIHGLLLGMEFDWHKKKNVHRPETRAITMTLAYLQPQMIQPKPVVKKSPAKSVLSPEAQKKPLISKKTLRAPVKPEKVIFEESETQEEIVTDIDVAVAVDIKKKAPVVRKAIPLYRVNPPPKYPRIARKRGYQGTVVLDVLVDQNGRVGDLRLFTSSGYSILDRKAMASVKGWLFEPGMKGDKKLDMWVRVPVRFELK